MHTYVPVKVTDPAELVSIAGKKFHDARDVVEYERIGDLVGWRTWPEVWHLDETGEMTCYSKGSSCDSIRRWAEDPYTLLSARELAVEGRCGDRWLIIESRTLLDDGEDPVTEADAKAFVELRRILGQEGIDLVDTVIFDGHAHWWSMHELTSGTTRWSVPAALDPR